MLYRTIRPDGMTQAGTVNVLVAECSANEHLSDGPHVVEARDDDDGTAEWVRIGRAEVIRPSHAPHVVRFRPD